MLKKSVLYSITIRLFNKEKQIQFILPSNYKESFYLDKVPYLTRQTPAVENNLINLIKNRDDLKR